MSTKKAEKKNDDDDDLADKLDSIDSEKIANAIKKMKNGNAMQKIAGMGELLLSIGLAVGKFVPVVGKVFNSVQILKDIIGAFLPDDEEKNKNDEDDKILALIGIAFGKHDLSDIEGRLNHLMIDLKVIIDLMVENNKMSQKFKENDDIEQLNKDYPKWKIMQVLIDKNINKNIGNHLPDIQDALDEYKETSLAQGKREDLFKTYKDVSLDLAGKLTSTINQISSQKVTTESKIANENIELLHYFIQVVTYRNIVFNLVALIIGPDITKLESVSDNDKEIKAKLNSATKLLFDKLAFLLEPKVKHKVFVSAFYGYSDPSNTIKCIESVLNKTFVDPIKDLMVIDALTLKLCYFVLYPKYWKTKWCLGNGAQDDKRSSSWVGRWSALTLKMICRGQYHISNKSCDDYVAKHGSISIKGRYLHVDNINEFVIFKVFDVTPDHIPHKRRGFYLISKKGKCNEFLYLSVGNHLYFHTNPGQKGKFEFENIPWTWEKKQKKCVLDYKKMY
eukprot:189351_1